MDDDVDIDPGSNADLNSAELPGWSDSPAPLVGHDLFSDLSWASQYEQNNETPDESQF